MEYIPYTKEYYNNQIDNNQINLDLIIFWKKIFNLLKFSKKLSLIISHNKEKILLKNDEEDKPSEINTSLMIKVAHKLDVKINDMIKNQDIRKIIIKSLWFWEKDRILVKNKRIFIIEHSDLEKRFNWFNQNQLKSIVSNSNFFDLNWKISLIDIISNHFDFNNFSENETKDFLTKNFKKYINKFIVNHIRNSLSDNDLEEWLSQFLYREWYEEINWIILDKLKKNLNNKDYNLILYSLKDSILKYLNINDEILSDVYSSTLLKLQKDFNKKFIKPKKVLVDNKEIEEFHKSLKLNFKKYFFDDISDIFFNKIWFKIDKTILNTIILSIYNDEKIYLKDGFSEFILEKILNESTWTTTPLKIKSFFSYYSWEKWKWPILKIDFIKTQKYDINYTYNKIVNLLIETKKNRKKVNDIKTLYNKKSKNIDILKLKNESIDIEWILKKKNNEMEWIINNIKKLSLKVKELEWKRFNFDKKNEINKINNEIKTKNLHKILLNNEIKDLKSKYYNNKSKIDYINWYKQRYIDSESDYIKNKKDFDKIVIALSDILF